MIEKILPVKMLITLTLLTLLPIATYSCGGGGGGDRERERFRKDYHKDPERYKDRWGL